MFVSAKVSQLALLPQGKVEAARRAKAMLSKMDALGFGNCTNTRAVSYTHLALIARDLWDMNEYYHVINDANESSRKALELLEQPDFEGLLLKKR